MKKHQITGYWYVLPVVVSRDIKCHECLVPLLCFITFFLDRNLRIANYILLLSLQTIILKILLDM
jgi:hypothetical protein